MSNSPVTKLSVALFVTIEVDGEPQMAAETPDLRLKVDQQDADAVLGVIKRLLGQDLVFPTDVSTTDQAGG